MDSSGSTRWQLEQAEGGHKNTPAVKIVLKLRKRSLQMSILTWNLWTSPKPPRLHWFPQFWHRDTVRPQSRWPDSVPQPEIRTGCSPGREIHTMYLPRFHRNDWILCPPAFLFLGLFCRSLFHDEAYSFSPAWWIWRQTPRSLGDCVGGTFKTALH